MWEYLTHDIRSGREDVQDELNKLGRQGWELVVFDRSDTFARISCVFKRKKKAR